MIYVVDFCIGNRVKFRNCFIWMFSWKCEIESGKCIFRLFMNVDGGIFLVNVFFNFIMGGMFMKDSVNMVFFYFVGRMFVLQDICLFWEFDLDIFEIILVCTFDGKLFFYVFFIVYLKVLLLIGEFIFFGFNLVLLLYCFVGMLKLDGIILSINSFWFISFVGSIFMYDFCVIEYFMVFFEGSMDIKFV